MTAPAVSVILPVYNGEAYLRAAIDSVFAQTLRDVELVVVDDGSRDGTPAILASYGARLRAVRQANTGVAGAVNHGLRLATGRYVSWLSHDDVFLPTKLERQLRALTELGTPGVCYTDVQLIDARGEPTQDMPIPEDPPGEALRRLLTGGPLCMASYSIMYDRRCLDEVGGYATSWPMTQDAHMLTRLVRRFPFVRIPEVLTQVRDHPDRGVRSARFPAEVVRFHREQLNGLSIRELFPELGERPTRAQRVRALLWLAETLETRGLPMCLVAFSQYRRALAEGATGAVAALPKAASLAWRLVAEKGTRDRLRGYLSA